MLAKIARYRKPLCQTPALAWGRDIGTGRLCGFLLICMVSGVSGCASNNVLASAETDPSLITGSIAKPKQAATVQPQAASDEVTIKNAVSSADLKAMGKGGISWANPATGSTGQISQVSEYKQDESLCRRFTTSRQSFDGVALYHGDACLDFTGTWRMIDFKAS
jgi:17 kDa outer membrane surface antigen